MPRPAPLTVNGHDAGVGVGGQAGNEVSAVSANAGHRNGGLSGAECTTTGGLATASTVETSCAAPSIWVARGRGQSDALTGGADARDTIRAGLRTGTFDATHAAAAKRRAPRDSRDDRRGVTASFPVTGRKPDPGSIRPRTRARDREERPLRCPRCRPRSRCRHGR